MAKLEDLKVGMRVVVYHGIRRRVRVIKLWKWQAEVQGIKLETPPFYVHPKQIRILRKKNREQVWLVIRNGAISCASFDPPSKLDANRWTEYVRVSKKK